eukprot:TRINITY_DN9572_c0_g1_i2.p2 TRINITY_DN9572_c0_g1~~TRINITY_DN9572_c0_g1_i2.p2  ORF type:complete len:180 (-),score=51.86 TRINITY_DN9572_c0_g1_i2:175-714(-)
MGLLASARRLAEDAGRLPKELALDVARHLGLLARAADSLQLLEMVHTVLASVAARAGQTHSIDFLVDALDVMCDVGGCEPEYIDMILTAAHVHHLKLPVTLEQARRIIDAMRWCSSAYSTVEKTFMLGAGSSRLVHAAANALENACTYDAAALDEVRARHSVIAPRAGSSRHARSLRGL